MVEILLATYNGERYIRELLDSLLEQTFTEWMLTVQDDISRDNTVKILEEYQANHPDKIRIIQNKKKLGGARNNFFSLLSQSTEQYVMCCDQDDVWLNDKIEITLSKMLQIEEKHAPNTPVLVHTDLYVADEQLAIINPSLFHMQKMDASRINLCQFIVQNIITGCTVMVNRPLLELMREKDHTGAVMHDWWMGLLAVSFGEIGFADKPTVLYRQHGKNEVGAKDVRTFRYKINRLVRVREIKKSLNDTYLQAQGFLNVYQDKLPAAQKELLSVYSDTPNHFKLKRLITVCRLGAFKNGLVRKIAHFIYI